MKLVLRAAGRRNASLSVDRVESRHCEVRVRWRETSRPATPLYISRPWPSVLTSQSVMVPHARTPKLPGRFDAPIASELVCTSMKTGVLSVSSVQAASDIAGQCSARRNIKVEGPATCSSVAGIRAIELNIVPGEWHCFWTTTLHDISIRAWRHRPY